jgi:hypothetical protein
MLQILEEHSDPLVALLRQRLVRGLDIVVAITRLTSPVVELDEAHGALRQPAGHQALPGVDPGAVHLLDRPWLLLHVEGVARLPPHPVRQFHRLDARLQRRVMLVALQVLLVELPEQVELALLRPGRGEVVLDVLDEPLDLRLPRIDVRALVGAGNGAYPDAANKANDTLVVFRTIHGDEDGSAIARWIANTKGIPGIVGVVSDLKRSGTMPSACGPGRPGAAAEEATAARTCQVFQRGCTAHQVPRSGRQLMVPCSNAKLPVLSFAASAC